MFNIEYSKKNTAILSMCFYVVKGTEDQAFFMVTSSINQQKEMHRIWRNAALNRALLPNILVRTVKNSGFFVLVTLVFRIRSWVSSDLQGIQLIETYLRKDV